MKNLENAQKIIYDHSKEAIDNLLHINLKLKQLLKDQNESDYESAGKLEADIRRLKVIAEWIIDLECMAGFYLKEDFKAPVSIDFFWEGGKHV